MGPQSLFLRTLAKGERNASTLYSAPQLANVHSFLKLHVLIPCESGKKRLGPVFAGRSTRAP